MSYFARCFCLAAVARPAKKRMLTIVTPYASTGSDRLKNLGAAEVLPDEGNLRRVLYTGPHTTPSAW